MSARAFSDYLKLKGQAQGYSASLSFYGLRRMAATDLVHRGVDVANAREILGHDPETCMKRNSCSLIPRD